MKNYSLILLALLAAACSGGGENKSESGDVHGDGRCTQRYINAYNDVATKTNKTAEDCEAFFTNHGSVSCRASKLWSGESITAPEPLFRSSCDSLIAEKQARPVQCTESYIQAYNQVSSKFNKTAADCESFYNAHGKGSCLASNRMTSREMTVPAADFTAMCSKLSEAQKVATGGTEVPKPGANDESAKLVLSPSEIDGLLVKNLPAQWLRVKFNASQFSNPDSVIYIIDKAIMPSKDFDSALGRHIQNDSGFWGYCLAFIYSPISPLKADMPIDSIEGQDNKGKSLLSMTFEDPKNPRSRRHITCKGHKEHNVEQDLTVGQLRSILGTVIEISVLKPAEPKK